MKMWERYLLVAVLLLGLFGFGLVVSAFMVGCRAMIPITNPVISPSVNLSSSTVNISPVVNLSSGVKVADEIKGVDLSQAKATGINIVSSTFIVTVSSEAVRISVNNTAPVTVNVNLPDKIVIGIIIGLVGGLFLIGIIIFLWRKGRKK